MYRLIREPSTVKLSYLNAQLRLGAPGQRDRKIQEKRRLAQSFCQHPGSVA